MNENLIILKEKTIVQLNTDDYEFLILEERPHECKVYKRYHGDKRIGRVVINKDETYSVYQLPAVLVAKALEYLGYADKEIEDA